MNIFISRFLNYVELQAFGQKAMTLSDWINELDNHFIKKEKILEGSGKISHQEAINKTEKEFKIYRDREIRELKSDFDLLMKSILIDNLGNKNGK